MKVIAPVCLSLSLLALSNPALPCSLPGPGFHGPERSPQILPSNGRASVLGFAVAPVDAMIVFFDRALLLETTSITSGDFGGEIIQAVLPSLDDGGRSYPIRFFSQNGSAETLVDVQVLDEEDTTPPGRIGPILPDVYFEEVGAGCYPGGYQVSFEFPSVEDDFGIAYYTLHRAETGEQIDASIHYEGSNQTLFIFEGREEGERCYRIAAHDHADNTSESESFCVLLGDAIPPPADAGFSDSGKMDAGDPVDPVDTGTPPPPNPNPPGVLTRESPSCGCEAVHTSTPKAVSVLLLFVGGLLVMLRKRKKLALGTLVAFAIVGAQPVEALACSWAPGLYEIRPSDNTMIPRNAVVTAFGAGVTSASGTLTTTNLSIALNPEFIYNGDLLGSAFSVDLEEFGVGSQPVAVTITTDGTFSSEVSASYRVSNETDTTPPSAPEIFESSGSWSQGDSCFNAGYWAHITLLPATDDFGVSHYRLVKSDGEVVYASVNTPNRVNLQAYRPSLDPDVEEECYRVEVHDIAGNVSTSEPYCFPDEGDPVPPPPTDAGFIDLGFPEDASQPDTGVDAGQPVDTGTTNETPGNIARADPTCGCSAARGTGSSGIGVLVLGAFLVLRRRRICRRT